MSDERQLMIIDTDCGVDDALALLLAFSYSTSWEVVAITCCHGNTAVDNACNNVLRVMHLCGVHNVPVYRGCEKPLLPLKDVTTVVHGNDGLGNVAHLYSTGSLKIEEENGVHALIRLVKQYPQQIHLVALAPLTNVAIAHRLDAEFLSNLKSFTFMGGNVYGVGNTNSAAEFNFASDPEAAHIVLSEVQCPTTMIPWETTLKHAMPWDLLEELLARDTERAQFLKNICKELINVDRKRKYKGMIEADMLAIAATIKPSCILETENYPVVVETAGHFTRGQAVICRRNLSEIQTRPTISVVTTMDETVLSFFNKNFIFDKISHDL